MFKNALVALAAIVMAASSAKADDLTNFDLESINDAEISIEEVAFDIDVDALEKDAGESLLTGNGDELDEAVGACFRRFGYGYGFGGGHWGGYHCYRPIYRSFCHSYCFYRPVVRYCVTPIYNNYWGCF